MDYAKLTVVKLKEELKARGIASTGLTRKQQIIDRLVEEDLKQSEQRGVDAGETAETGATESSEAEDQDGGDAEAVKTDDQTEEKDKAEAPAEDEPIAKSPPRKQIEASDTPDDGNDRGPVTEPVLSKAEESAPRTHQENGNAQRGAVETAAPPLAAERIPAETQVDRVELSHPQNLAQIPQNPSTTAEAGSAGQAGASPAKLSTNLEDDLQTGGENKRKRRSLTPPVLEAEVKKKKLKQDEVDTVHMVPDVEMGDDAQPSTNSAQVTASQEGRHNGDGQDRGSNLQSPATTETQPSSLKVAAEAAENTDKVVLESSAVKETTSATHDEAVEDSAVQPSLHPATNTLYIRNLKRPLQIQSFRQHISSLAREPDAIAKFHLDSIRTHAFVQFSSTNAAGRVRRALHDKIWPEERDREALWVDYIPDDKIVEWIDRETGADPGGRGSMKRWEVAYTRVTESRVEARLQEVFEARSRQPTYERLAEPVTRRPSLPVPERKQPAPMAFVNLDQRFKSTKAKPKLYWLPVDQKLVDNRLDELDDLTTRKGKYPVSGSGWPDSRRYTFEGGDRLVDDGPEYGLRHGRSGTATGRRGPRMGPRGGRNGDGRR